MSFGLNEKEIDFLFKTLINPLKNYNIEVFLFGSRAKGTHNKFSDVDLLIRGNIDKKTRALISEIDELLIESSFPYKVDLVYEEDLAQSYKEDIIKSLIRI